MDGQGLLSVRNFATDLVCWGPRRGELCRRRLLGRWLMRLRLRRRRPRRQLLQRPLRRRRRTAVALALGRAAVRAVCIWSLLQLLRLGCRRAGAKGARRLRVSDLHVLRERPVSRNDCSATGQGGSPPTVHHMLDHLNLGHRRRATGFKRFRIRSQTRPCYITYDLERQSMDRSDVGVRRERPPIRALWDAPERVEQLRDEPHLVGADLNFDVQLHRCDPETSLCRVTELFK
jgi:hypothetical protein